MEQDSIQAAGIQRHTNGSTNGKRLLSGVIFISKWCRVLLDAHYFYLSSLKDRKHPFRLRSIEIKTPTRTSEALYATYTISFSMCVIFLKLSVWNVTLMLPVWSTARWPTINVKKDEEKDARCTSRLLNHAGRNVRVAARRAECNGRD